MTTIVRELPEHLSAVRQVTIDAFENSAFGHHGEADLIEAIRDSPADIVSLVALEAANVIGHILFSSATIRVENSTIHGTGLGPMSVAPSHQRRGVGSLLVQEGLRTLAKTDAAFTFVSGHPEYYPRFGFLPARQFSVTHGFAGMPQDIFFIHLVDQAHASRIRGGKAYYHAAFGPQHVE